MNNPIRFSILAALGAALLAAWMVDARGASSSARDSGAESERARGRYLVQIGGCNDCHTPGYAVSAGKVPESDWLTGDAVGWQGPWGTTYAANLRLSFQNWSEEQWFVLARQGQLRPPMPWFNLRDMNDADLRAIYRYIRHQGPAGKPAPAYVPPGQPVQGPVIAFPAPPSH